MNWFFTFHARSLEGAEKMMEDDTRVGEMPVPIREAVFAAMDTVSDALTPNKMMQVMSTGHIGPDATVSITVCILDAPV